MNGGVAAAGQHPQPYLDHVHHRKHQKQAPHDGPDGGAHHPEPQNSEVNVGPESFIHIFAVQQIDGELQALRYQGGEKEEAEGDDLEDQELFSNANAGIAGGSILETVLAWGGQRKSNEDGDGEKGVNVDEAVQGGDVNACCR
ncbi:hypothetical protein V6N11_016204 [Hibiscus sabdariffa]|uniref:Uncharacterized protein n=1 Tax=Hibiscus sabdariffa TaxID=183260 RepID=A0ABR2TUH9_9ROSI